MDRTAALTILFMLVLCWPSVSAADDPPTFLVAFSGDSGRLVVASHRDGIKVLSVPDLQEIRSIALPDGRRLRSAVVSPSGRWLAADDNGDSLLIWNLETGEAQPGVPNPRHSHLVYVFGPGDDTLFVYEGRLRIWDVKQAREVGVVNEVENVEMMTVSSDGRYVVVYGTRCRPNRDVCVCSVDQKNIVVAAAARELFTPKPEPIPVSEIGNVDLNQRPVSTLDLRWNAADLVYTKDDRILLTFRGPAPDAVGVSHVRRPSYQSGFLKPDDLTMLEKAVVEPERGWMYPGLRSAPTRQTEAVSPDAKWKVTAFHKRLYLYRVTSETTRALEKFIPIP